ncbi:MAG: hypothetical protein JSW44_04010 [Candidatus Bathyarchaeota archaeon]|nr:MAG: hypothetical protein JSW44_04010 [Candidatus Bathyarchaeota archaeon]
MKPEEIDTIEKRGKYTVSVVGCRQIGILYVIAFLDAGYKVISTDADQSLVKSLTKGKTSFADREVKSKLKRFARKGQLSATSDLKSAVSQSDIIIITITAKIDGKKSSDYSEAKKSCKQIGATLRRDTLAIYAGIAGFGFTEGVIKETLENASGLRVGEDFGLVYNPIHISNAQIMRPISNQELKIAAIDKTSLNTASTVLETITEKGIKKIFGIKTLEAAELFTVAKRDANVALANELAVFCENAGLDYFEILRFLSPELQETYFSPTIAEEESRNGTYLLLESAESLPTKLRLTALARQINEKMVRHAINLTQDALRSAGKTLRRARVALLGRAKPKTAALLFAKMLEKKGTKASLYDPSLSKTERANMTRMFKRSLNEATEGTDCVVILSEQAQFKRLNLKKLRAVMKTPAAIVDLTGIIEPQKVEKEGFIYRGLGRRAEKK